MLSRASSYGATLVAILTFGLTQARAEITVAADAGANTGAVATTAVTPVRLPPALAEVAKLSDAGVDPKVIKAYIDASAYAYNPSPDQIIALKNHGVSDDLIEVLIHHGTQVRQQLAQQNTQSSLPMTAAQVQTPQMVTTQAPVVEAPLAGYDTATYPVYNNYYYSSPAYPAYSYGYYNSWLWPSVSFGFYPRYYGHYYHPGFHAYRGSHWGGWSGHRGGSPGHWGGAGHWGGGGSSHWGGGHSGGFVARGGISVHGGGSHGGHR